jgi:hypothetical protein
MDSTHIRGLEESLDKNTVQKILKAENGRIGKDIKTKRRTRKYVLLHTYSSTFSLFFLPYPSYIKIKRRTRKYVHILILQPFLFFSSLSYRY